MLEGKAGKAELNAIHQLKTNKSDTELIMKWLDLMQRQLKQLSVIQTEVAGALVQRPKESDLQRNNRLEFVTTQSYKVSQWINKFDIQDIN